jgi:hypothetical protein
MALLSALVWTRPGAAAPEQAVIRLPLSAVPVTVNGTLAPGEWDDAVILGGDFVTWGPTPTPNSPTVYVKRTPERLYIAYDNPLGPGERPVMRGAMPDNGGICSDHAVEFYIMPEKKPGDLTSFIQFGGNARGAVFDTKQTPQIGISDVAGFTLPWQFKNTLAPGHWYAEVSATFAELGVGDTSNGRSFDADFCRDGGCGAWGYMCTFAGIAAGNGVKVLFDDTAPIVQWLSFGDYAGNRFNPSLRIQGGRKGGTYTVSVQVTESAIDPNTQTYRERFGKTETVSLAPGEPKAFGAFFALQPKSTGVAHYRITGDRGDIVFYRQLPFTTSNPARTYPTYEPKPLVVKAQMAPSYGRILAAADILDLPGDKSKALVAVGVSREGQTKPLANAAITEFPYDYGQAILQVSDGPLPPGVYVVTFTSLNTETKQPLAPETMVKLVRQVHPWENNTLGVTDKVFHPWTPMRVDGETVHCWGREYRFDGLALPAAILTLQPEPSRGPAVRDVLAGPVRLVAESRGKPLAWTAGGKRVTAATETHVDLTGSAEAPGLRAEVQGALEFDGFYKIRLTLTPTAATPLDSIRVEVPLPTAGARLFNHSAEGMRVNKTFADLDGLKNGVIWDSKTAAHNALVKGNFVPIVWIGDEDRGVAWMCDNDKTWVTTFDTPCLDVVRKGRETAFRMHLLNQPGELAKPIEVTFSLQATPIKPRPPGGSWKAVDWYGWGYFDKPLIYQGCFDTVGTNGLAGEAWYRTPEARAENRWWRYCCFNSDRIAADDPTYGQYVRDFWAEWYVDAPLAFVQNRAHTDFILWAYSQWHDRASLDGVYHDNTFAVAWPGLINDTGWVDDAGRLRAGYWVMAYREFAKRERAYWLSVGPPPVLKSHVTDAPIIGYLGFSDFWLDGENGGYPDPAVPDPDFVDRWYNRTGMANLRITLGRQWGAMPQYLYQWGKDATATVLGLLDLPGYTTTMGQKPFFAFGDDAADCEFIPYWDIRHLVAVRAGGPDVLAAAWKRPGRVRVMVSNMADEDRDATLRLDAAGLGLPDDAAATDEQTCDPLEYRRGAVEGLRVNRHSYRLLLLAARGTFPATDPAMGKALEPRQRIAVLCDDFAELRPDWQRILSPHCRKMAGPQKENFTSQGGYLRILGSRSTYSALYRPFNQDNCSVQVKIPQATGFYWHGFGPMLALYWETNKYVRMLSGVEGQKTSCEGASGDRTFRKEGAESGRWNWVKIALRPDALEFLWSTDGQSWQPLHTQPRAGYEGAPPYLFLGNGAPGVHAMMRNEQWLESYTFHSYFDDLLTGKD